MKYQKSLSQSLMIVTFVSLPFYAFPYPVEDFVTEAQTVLIEANAVTQVATLASQLAVLQQQLKSLAQQKPGSYQWSDATNKLNELAGIVNQGNAFAYSSANAATRFQQLNPGYTPPQDFSQEYKDRVGATMDTLNGVLRSTNSSASDFLNDSSRIKYLQQQGETPQGQTQALQTGLQMSSEMLNQMQLLRQTQLAQTNAQTAYYAQQVQDKASAAAAQEKLITSGSQETKPYGTSGNNLQMPNFG